MDDDLWRDAGEGRSTDEAAFGRCRLLSLTDEGSMGKVYKAHDTEIGRDVALKVLPHELGTEPGYRQRFRRDAHIAARLTGPHIAEISSAHLLTNNDELHDALDRVTAAALNGPEAETNFRRAAIWEGQPPIPAPIFMVMEELQRVIGAARRLAGRLLVTSWD
jgi:serine/threonine protein kinase